MSALVLLLLTCGSNAAQQQITTASALQASPASASAMCPLQQLLLTQSRSCCDLSPWMDSAGQPSMRSWRVTASHPFLVSQKMRMRRPSISCGRQENEVRSVIHCHCASRPCQHAAPPHSARHVVNCCARQALLPQRPPCHQDEHKLVRNSSSCSRCTPGSSPTGLPPHPPTFSRMRTSLWYFSCSAGKSKI